MAYYENCVKLWYVDIFLILLFSYRTSHCRFNMGKPWQYYEMGFSNHIADLKSLKNIVCTLPVASMNTCPLNDHAPLSHL